jgi:hypothetical protein
LGFVTEPAVVVETGCQPNHVFMAIDDANFVVTEAGNKQVEAIGAEIQCRIGVAVLSPGSIISLLAA